MSVGIVIRISGIKSAVVKVERTYTHSLYKKRIKDHSNIMVHDEIGAKVGDKVKIASSRPISKRKRHVVKEIL